jgi:uncharacterized protein (DUF362 family)
MPPTLVKPPIRVPAVRLSDHRETVMSREHLSEGHRELMRANGMGTSRPREKTTHPEISKARAKAARLKVGRW